MTIKTPITLDLVNRQAPIIVHVVQLDENIRQIEARLTNRGAAIDLTGMGAEFRMAKPDGTYVYYDTDEQGDPAVTISGSVVTVTLVAAALQVAGDGQAQIDIYDGNGKVSSFAFTLRIHPSTVPDGAISETYVNALTALANRAETAATDAEAAQAAAEAAASGTVRFDVSQTLTSAQQTQARNNISAHKTFTALTEIGCSTSSTLAQIAAAMPSAASVLVINRCGKSIDTGTVFSNALPANYGTLIVRGTTANSGVCHFEFYRYRTTAEYEAYKKNIDVSSGNILESGWAYDSEYITELLTLGSAWSANASGRNQVSKEGSRCILTISAKCTSAMSPSSATTIATISSEYRPSFTVYGLLYGYHSSTPTICRVTVNTTGVVEIQGTTAANTSITGMIVYDV